MRTAPIPSSSANNRQGARRAALRLPALGGESILGVRRAEQGVRWMLALIGIIVVVAAFAAIVVRLPVSIGASGVLQPWRTWAVRSLVPGVVAEMLVQPGAVVGRGQLVGRLDTLELAGAAFEMGTQVRERTMDRERLKGAAPLEAELERQRLEKAEASLVRARAELRLQLLMSERDTDVESFLFSYRAGEHVDLDRAVSDVRSARAELAIAESQRQLGTFRSMEVQRLTLGLERSRREASLAQERVRRLDLVSPAGGIVITEHIEELVGRTVREGDEVLIIADTSHWRVELLVGEPEVLRIRQGDSAFIDVPALSRFEDVDPIRGTVTFVGAAPSNHEAGPVVRQAGYSVLVALSYEPFAGSKLGQVRQGLSVRAKIVSRRVQLWRLLWEALTHE